jgi:hypothetical protein
VAAPKPLSSKHLKDETFTTNVNADDLVYFCLSVGDADAQVVLLPVDAAGNRRLLVIDAGVTKKIPQLLDALEALGWVDLSGGNPNNDYPIAVIVATHPHHDHISGMAELIKKYGKVTAEFWEPGFFHTAPAYARMMQAVADQPHLIYSQPTSGLQRWFGPVGVTVLSPSIGLRNRFDTYGVDINDSSISLRLEYPASRVVEEPQGQRNYAPNVNASRLILGADAQTLSWSYALTDFPYLVGSESSTAKALGAAGGDWNLLRADVLKVAHHGSKHGINLELVERVAPWLTIVSSTGDGPSYGFPHTVTQEVIREALQPTAGGTKKRESDEELRLFYTSDTVKKGSTTKPVGSFAVVMKGRRRRVWRFMDEPDEAIDFASARRWDGPGMP